MPLRFEVGALARTAALECAAKPRYELFRIAEGLLGEDALDGPPGAFEKPLRVNAPVRGGRWLGVDLAVDEDRRAGPAGRVVDDQIDPKAADDELLRNAERVGAQRGGGAAARLGDRLLVRAILDDLHQPLGCGGVLEELADVAGTGEAVDRRRDEVDRLMPGARQGDVDSLVAGLAVGEGQDRRALAGRVAP